MQCTTRVKVGWGRDLFLLSVLLLLVIVNPLRTMSAPAVTMVTLSGERIEQSSPAVFDFNQDGDKEIVIGGRDGILYVLAYQSSVWSVAWSRQVAQDLNSAGAPGGSPCVTNKGDIRSAPAIADLNADGRVEIVVTTGGDPANHRNGGVLVYTQSAAGGLSFSLVPGWPQPKLDIVGSGAGSGYPDGCWDGIWGAPALGDLDGDGDLEVVVEGFDRRLHAWHHTGVAVTGWPISRDNGDAILRGGWSSPALGDIDGDGLPEVVVGTDSPPWEGEGTDPDYTKGTIWAINGDSTNVPGWPVTTQNNFIQSAPALGDIDGDGELEIVIGSGSTVNGGNGHLVYALNGDGSSVSGWPRTTGGDTPAPPALADLDNDGDLEIVIGCGKEGDAYNPAPCTSLYAWHGNGAAVSGFPLTPQNNNPWPSDPNGLPYTPIIADYDNDGSLEILALNRWSWGISTIRKQGGSWVSANDTTLRTNNALSSIPVVDDVDDDGLMEIIVGGSNSAGTQGAIYIFKMTGAATAARPWPMFHRDVQRTGLYPLPPKPPQLAFPKDLYMFYQSGSGTNATTSAVVMNTGGGQFDWSIQSSIAGLQINPASGSVTSTAVVQFTFNPNGLTDGWHDLGTLQVTGTLSGSAVADSPRTAELHLFIGNVTHVYLPLVLKKIERLAAEYGRARIIPARPLVCPVIEGMQWPVRRQLR